MSFFFHAYSRLILHDIPFANESNISRDINSLVGLSLLEAEGLLFKGQ